MLFWKPGPDSRTRGPSTEGLTTALLAWILAFYGSDRTSIPMTQWADWLLLDGHCCLLWRNCTMLGATNNFPFTQRSFLRGHLAIAGFVGDFFKHQPWAGSQTVSVCSCAPGEVGVGRLGGWKGRCQQHWGQRAVLLHAVPAGSAKETEAARPYPRGGLL